MHTRYVQTNEWYAFSLAKSTENRNWFARRAKPLNVLRSALREYCVFATYRTSARIHATHALHMANERKLIDLFHPTSQHILVYIYRCICDFHINLAILWLWSLLLLLLLRVFHYAYVVLVRFLSIPRYSLSLLLSFESIRIVDPQQPRQQPQQAKHKRKYQLKLEEKKNHCKSSMQNNGQLRSIILLHWPTESRICREKWKKAGKKEEKKLYAFIRPYSKSVAQDLYARLFCI